MKIEASALLRGNTFQTDQIFQIFQRFVLTFLFLAALGIRLIQIGEPPLNFQATRQYRSLIIARDDYFETASSIPDWEKQVAHFSRVKQGVLEPPVMELLVSAGYRLAGGEEPWLPHLLSSLFWLAGGVFLYRIAKRFTNEDAPPLAAFLSAVVPVAFYLFLPFTVIASRSFQPDPLMVLLLLASLWAVLRFFERLSPSRWIAATAFSALAFFIKPASLFLIAGAFLALAIQRYGLRKGLLSKNFWLFLVAAAAPTLAIYLYGVVSGSFLVGEAEKTLMPGLLLTTFFWSGWLGNINAVVGYVCFIGALLGIFLLEKGRPKALLIGAWAGYGVFCMALNYNVATHDYYQLPLVPIVALSLGPLVGLAAERVLAVNREWYWRAGVIGILLLALAIGIEQGIRRLADPGAEQTVQLEQAIGDQVSHSTHTVFLASDYGVSLEYNGLLSGQPWPLASDLEWEKLAGLPFQNAPARFQTWFAQKSPDYFIVLDFSEYSQQPDLKAFLTEHYPISAQGDGYLIFNLKQEKARSSP